MSKCVIKLNSPDEIIYERNELKMDPYITKDIYNDNSSVVIGNKKSYLLYQGSNYDLMGYCHSLSFALDVIRSRMSSLITSPENKYQIHIKKVKQNINNEYRYEFKFYLYQQTEGWIYNGLTLLNKFKITEIPKIEMKYNSSN